MGGFLKNILIPNPLRGGAGIGGVIDPIDAVFHKKKPPPIIHDINNPNSPDYSPSAPGVKDYGTQFGHPIKGNTSPYGLGSNHWYFDSPFQLPGQGAPQGAGPPMGSSGGPIANNQQALASALRTIQPVPQQQPQAQQQQAPLGLGNLTPMQIAMMQQGGIR